MFKITQRYTDFDGHERVEELYFNFTEPQLREFLDKEPTFKEKNLANLIATKDNKLMLEALQKLIIAAYGEKSSDGRVFRKNQEIRENFEGSAAFEQLMDDLMYKGDTKTVEELFINIFPSKFSATIREEMEKAEKMTDAEKITAIEAKTV